jgi:cell division protein FtsB
MSKLSEAQKNYIKGLSVAELAQLLFLIEKKDSEQLKAENAELKAENAKLKARLKNFWTICKNKISREKYL